MAPSKELASFAPLPSASSGLEDLIAETPDPGQARRVLDTGADWAARWSASWKVSGAEVTCPARDLGSFPVPGCEPVRRFSWRREQRHRPGLQFMVSTGLHHGFESLEEARLLLALDFAEAVTQVICQPFRLRFTAADGPAEHIPDVLAVASGGVWLIDVRPAARIGEADRVKFAASAEAARACGWRYLVVTGWRPSNPSVRTTRFAMVRSAPRTGGWALAVQLGYGTSRNPATVPGPAAVTGRFVSWLLPAAR